MKVSKRLRKLGSKIKRLVGRFVVGNPDAFLTKISGVVHVGANIGQERLYYSNLNLAVIWIEPIPHIYSQLVANITNLNKQEAHQYLLTDEVGKEVVFHIANNNGESSSVFEFGLHKVMRPDISMTRSIRLQTTTLDELVGQKVVALENFEALIVDTQGAELLVLRGARKSLKEFRFVRVEAANFEAYAGGCTIDDICVFMRSEGFAEVRRDPTSRPKDVGRYFEILFEKTLF